MACFVPTCNSHSSRSRKEGQRISFHHDSDEDKVPKETPRKYDIHYMKAVPLLYFHLAGLYGLYLGFTAASLKTIVFAFVLYVWGSFGITGGAHRLWTHKTYKAKYYFEMFIMLCNCLAYQLSVYKWVRDHRLHHKYSDTDADPHNAKRGFFYSHIGWLLVQKSDLVKAKGKEIDMSDILSNPILQFQRKYQLPLFGLICFILPTVIPILCWDETFKNAWHLNMFRYCFTLNVTFLVNSFAHMYGNKPYNSKILPTQNIFVSLVAGGEGFHNFHHCFPWDYRAAEIGNNFLNPTTKMLDLFARIGWIYDLKQADPKLVENVARSNGDGTNCWGLQVQGPKRLDDAL